MDEAGETATCPAWAEPLCRRLWRRYGGNGRATETSSPAGRKRREYWRRRAHGERCCARRRAVCGTLRHRSSSRRRCQVRGIEMGLNPGTECVLHELQLAGKEVVRPGDHHQFGGGDCLGHDGFYFRLRAKFVLRSADKELG